MHLRQFLYWLQSTIRTPFYKNLYIASFCNSVTFSFLLCISFLFMYFAISVLLIHIIQGLLEFIWTERCYGRSSDAGPALAILLLWYVSVNFSFPNSTTGANFRPFFCAWYVLQTSTDLSLLKVLFVSVVALVISEYWKWLEKIFRVFLTKLSNENELTSIIKKLQFRPYWLIFQ